MKEGFGRRCALVMARVVEFEFGPFFVLNLGTHIAPCSRVGHAKACCALEVTARTSHHGLAPKERGLPPVPCPSMSRRSTTTSATRRARSQLTCFATSGEIATAVGLARVPSKRRLPVGGHSSLVPPRSCTDGERPRAGAVLFDSTYADCSQRGTARARCKLACFATSRETASAVALVRVPRECRLRVGGHSSHVAPWPRTVRMRPPAGAVLFHSARPITTSAARCARVVSSRVLPPPERQLAQ